ncbi:MAG: ABC transporter permease subunit [Armatimonadota bacterium]|jgi:ABC-type transport system involved in multi-copper enzyme maturation permease subunit
MRTVYHLARQTVREAMRRRFLNVILLFAIVIIGASSMFSQWSPGAELKMLLDTGLGLIRFFSMLMAVFIGAVLIPTEVEKKTAHVLLSKPVNRSHFLLGKFLGAFATVAINVFIMGAVFVLVVFLKRTSIEQIPNLYSNLSYAVLLLACEMLVLLSVTVMVSTIASWVFTSVFAFAVYFAGHVSASLKHLATPEFYESAVARGIIKVLYVVLPHFEDFDVREAIIVGDPIEWPMLGSVVGLGLLYSCVMIVLGWLFFSEREV